MNNQNNYRINEDLQTTNLIRLVGDNITPGIYSYNEAINLAKQLNLDLVEIAKQKESICKIIDFKKFLYQKQQKEKEIKKNSTKVTIKEIRFRPNTDAHDFDFKVSHAQKFLKEGNKVKVTVKTSGRETSLYKDKIIPLLNRFISALSEDGVAEGPIKNEGINKTTILIASKK